MVRHLINRFEQHGEALTQLVNQAERGVDGGFKRGGLILSSIVRDWSIWHVSEPLHYHANRLAETVRRRAHGEALELNPVMEEVEFAV